MVWSILRRRDAIAGLTLVVLAIAAIALASTYPAGGRNTIGPAILPIWAAAIFGIIGLLLIVPAALREFDELAIGDLRPIAFIGLAFVTFALAIERLGLLPATFVAALVAGLAIGEQSWVGRLITAVALCVAAALFFVELLGLPLRLIAWPS